MENNNANNYNTTYRPRKKAGIITFGIMLLLSGLTILLKELGIPFLIEDYYLLWPIFLIILGCEFIIIRLSDKGGKRIIPAVGSIILTVVLLLVMTTFNFISGMDIPKMNWNGNNLTIMKFDNTYTKMIESTPIKTRGVDTIDFNMDFVDISIRPSENKTFHYKAIIDVNTDMSLEEVGDFSQFIEVNAGDILKIRSANPFGRSQLKVVKMEIIMYVPDKVDIDLAASHSDLRLEDLVGDMNINCRYTDILIDKIKGDIIVETTYADLNVYHIDGNADLTNQYGGIDTADIDGKLNVRNSFGYIDAYRIKSDTDVKIQHDDLKLRDINGKISVKAEYSEIEIIRVTDEIVIFNKHGDIEIEDASGKIRAENQHGDINLEDMDYGNTKMEIKARSGEINSSINLNIDSHGSVEEAKYQKGNGKRQIILITEFGDINID